MEREGNKGDDDTKTGCTYESPVEDVDDNKINAVFSCA